MWLFNARNPHHMCVQKKVCRNGTLNMNKLHFLFSKESEKLPDMNAI